MAEDILSAEEVEYWAREMGWEHTALYEHGRLLHVVDIQHDPRFLFPLETLLMDRGWRVEPHSFYASHGIRGLTWAAFEEFERGLFDKYLRADSHKAAVLEAAKAAGNGDGG